MSSEIYKLYIPQIIVLLLGIIIISEYFLAIPTLGIISSWARELGILVFSAAMVVAVVGVAIRSIREIKRRTPGEWYFHIWLLIFLFSWIITGCVLTSAHTFYKWLFENFITALYQAMLGLCVFSLFTLFYRFKPRLQLESILLSFTAVITMICGVPIGEVIFPGATALRKWIIEIPVMAVERALMIVMALGVVGLCLRTILGLERSWLGILGALIPTYRRWEKD
jgi:uncharacterized membrane protein